MKLPLGIKAADFIRVARIANGTKQSRRRERFALWMIGCAELWTGLVVVLSAGFLNSEVRPSMLFSVELDEFIEGNR